MVESRVSFPVDGKVKHFKLCPGVYMLPKNENITKSS